MGSKWGLGWYWGFGVSGRKRRRLKGKAGDNSGWRNIFKKNFSLRLEWLIFLLRNPGPHKGGLELDPRDF